MSFTRTLIIGFCCAGLTATGFGSDDFFDRVDEALTRNAFDGMVRARLSGALDLEGYSLQQPAPSIIYTDSHNLFNPRLTLFLDAQLGPRVYLYAQGAIDRGFDPGDGNAQSRFDEYAVRVTPSGEGVLNLQLGKFATVVGNWTLRHSSWDNPFITAPLPYANLTGIWDAIAARTSDVLLAWASVIPHPSHGGEYLDKDLSVPIVWGPSYASGAAAFGSWGKFNYAVEMKNASLSSRPEVWDIAQTQWQHPTWSGRLGWRPNQMWSLGISASAGSYLRPLALPTIMAGTSLDDYREVVFGQDVSFAWHHVQIWAEGYQARFEIPRVGDVRTFAYYVESKVKLTPRCFVALRLNQQSFSTVRDRLGSEIHWGRDIQRIDFGPGYRFTPHMQFKLQYSWQHEAADLRQTGHTVAGQFTLRF